MRSDAPGRIPESLIDAAIDGELNVDIQREIAHALQYDPIRKQELLDTSDAINAMQMPIAMPDFADVVLARADHHRKYIPAAWRSHVRAGRLGIAAVLLMSLMTIAGLQRLYPRLTTLASHPTPVLNIESAVEQDATELAVKVNTEYHALRASVAPMARFLALPGRTDQSFEITLSSVAASDFPSRFQSEFRLVRFENASSMPSLMNISGVSSMGGWALYTQSGHSQAPHVSHARLVRFPKRHNADLLDVPALP